MDVVAIGRSWLGTEGIIVQDGEKFFRFLHAINSATPIFIGEGTGVVAREQGEVDFYLKAPRLINKRDLGAINCQTHALSRDICSFIVKDPNEAMHRVTDALKAGRWEYPLGVKLIGEEVFPELVSTLASTK